MSEYILYMNTEISYLRETAKVKIKATHKYVPADPKHSPC